MLAAAIIFGYFADWLGRRASVAFGAFLGVFSAIICAFSTSFPMFVACRCLVAFGLTGCFNSAFLLLAEVSSPSNRPIYSLSVFFGWCLGCVALPAIAWVLRDWFWIQVALTLPCLIMLFTWWMVPESPRWLVTWGRLNGASKTLFQAAELNGVSITNIDATLKKVMARATDVGQSSEVLGLFCRLLRKPGSWQMVLIIYLMWFVSSFVHCGLSYSTKDVAGNPFVDFAVSGAVEFPAYFFSIFATRMLGRRNPLAGCLVIGGLACLLSYPLPQNPWWLTVTVSMIGQFCLTCANGIMFVFTLELFPTVVRGMGLGSAVFCAKIGTILAPYLKEMGVASHPVLPQIAFGILAAISGALVLLLPETNFCCLPDTIQETAGISQRRPKKPKGNSQNGHHMVVTLSNGEAESPVDDFGSQAIFAPSPKPQTNGKKLTDVPEEDTPQLDFTEDNVPETTSNAGGATNAAYEESPDDSTEMSCVLVPEQPEVQSKSDVGAVVDAASTTENVKGPELGEIPEVDERGSESCEQSSEL